MPQKPLALGLGFIYGCSKYGIIIGFAMMSLVPRNGTAAANGWRSPRRA